MPKSAPLGAWLARYLYGWLVTFAGWGAGVPAYTAMPPWRRVPWPRRRPPSLPAGHLPSLAQEAWRAG